MERRAFGDGALLQQRPERAVVLKDVGIKLQRLLVTLCGSFIVLLGEVSRTEVGFN